MLRLFRSYRKNEDGVVAIEFALLSIPFIYLFMGILELSLFFASAVVLEGSSSSASRLIRTGQLQGVSDPQQVFEDMLCDLSQDILDCTELRYESIVITGGTFTDAQAAAPQFDANGYLLPQGFSAGGSEDIILVRSAYRYEFLTPMIGTLITANPSQNWLNLVSTTVIKNEPFEFGG